MKEKFVNILALFMIFYMQAPGNSNGNSCFAQTSDKNITFYGQLRQSDKRPLRSSTVLLLQYNPDTKSVSVVDSATTDFGGDYRFNKTQPFNKTQQYYILALPNESYDYEFPTYYGTSLFLEKATPLTVLNPGEEIEINFTTIKKKSSSGRGAIGGHITTNGAPVPSLRVFLFSQNNNPAAFESTDSSGYFKFNKISYGIYFLWIDFPGVDNSVPDKVTIHSLNPVKDSLNFRIEESNLIWTDNAYTSIKDALLIKTHVYYLQLNSLQYNVMEQSLIIRTDGSVTLKPAIGELTNLETLEIAINQITTLPAEIGKLTKLTLLNASLNKLSTLPPTIENLKNLEVLDLGKNNFKKFPEVICKLSSLEVLSLQNNPFDSLPGSISNLKNLKSLSLENNFELLELPPQIGKLHDLETLKLSNCTKLRSLPKELNNLKNLKMLDITGTKLNAKDFQKAVPECEVRDGKK
ncbi:MAG: hypothetical protein HY840_07360 [Bacteroidetes bacterium]|nr:hypothetical protein [Bacteroidota bacterium]